MKNRIYKNDCYGGIAFRVAVCLVSLVILGGAIVMILKTFEMNKNYDHEWAVKLSDIGIQEAFGRIADPDFSVTDEPYHIGEDGDSGTYSVTVTREERGDSVYIKVVSTGKVRSASQTQVKEHVLPRDHPALVGGAYSASENDPASDGRDGPESGATDKQSAMPGEGK